MREVVEHRGAVLLIALDDYDNVFMVRQYRHPVGRVLLELPAGTIDEGEQPEVCAVRELREETGFRPRSLESLGGFFLSPGYSNEYIHLFLATGVEEAPLEHGRRGRPARPAHSFRRGVAPYRQRRDTRREVDSGALALRAAPGSDVVRLASPDAGAARSTHRRPTIQHRPRAIAGPRFARPSPNLATAPSGPSPLSLNWRLSTLCPIMWTRSALKPQVASSSTPAAV